jgi:hypothetical protein
VSELRPAYLPPDPAGRTVYVAGEIARYDFWFPDICLPVGFGQSRTAKLLPVLTMVLGTPGSPRRCWCHPRGRGTLAAKAQICKPADPEAKGLVERLHDYLEGSLCPAACSRHRPTSTPNSAGSWLARTRLFPQVGIERENGAVKPVDWVSCASPSTVGDRVNGYLTGWGLAMVRGSPPACGEVREMRPRPVCVCRFGCERRRYGPRPAVLVRLSEPAP